MNDGPPGWATDTAIDLYTPLYLALAGKHISPDAADQMDLTVVAAMLGIGREDTLADDWRAEMIAARKAGRDWG